MEIAEFGGFSLYLGLISSGNEREYGDSDGVRLEASATCDDHHYHWVDIPWADLNGLINALQHAQRQRAAAEATVPHLTGQLLQMHRTQAPGD